MRPPDGIGDHLLDDRLVIGGIGFMAGAEIEHIPRPPLVGQARAEHLAALEPADEDRLQRLGHAKGLAIHLFILKLEAIGQPGSDGMVAAGDP